MTVLRDYVLMSPRGSFELAHGQPKTGLLYRKELAYPGHFVKEKDDGEVEFELPVDESMIDHWVSTFDKMKGNGVDVPVPIGHNTEPENRRGTVERMTKEWNPKRNAHALYSYIRFSDVDTANKLKDSNVSLFMPPEFVDGKQNRYKRPIRHVAITDYPVIPDLAPFEKAIGASYVAMSMAEEKENTMAVNWEEVAQELGVEVPEWEDAMAAVKQAWESCEGEGGEGEGEGDELVDEELPVGEEEIPEEEFGFADDDDGGFDFNPENIEMPENRRRQGKKRTAPPEMAFSFDGGMIPATIVNQVVEARRTKIQALVNARKMSPAMGKELVKEFCVPKSVGIALSHESSGLPSDNFDKMIRACSFNTAVAGVGERTAAQHNRSSDGKTPIEIDAERRQAEMAKRRGQ